jgi:DNA-binding transcriptional ArsR family regulator
MSAVAPFEVFAALADPTRQRLLDQLAGHEHASAGTLAEPLGLTRQAVEKHLRLLDRAGVVTSRRQGRRVDFALRTEALRDSARWLDDRARGWDRQLGLVKAAAEAAQQ